MGNAKGHPSNAAAKEKHGMKKLTYGPVKISAPLRNFERIFQQGDYPSWPGTTVQVARIRLTQYQAERGFQTILKFRVTFFANPSPVGRGCREAAGEGCSDEENSKKIQEMFVVPLTRPADAGHPLPSGEGFSKKHFSSWTAVRGPEGGMLEQEYVTVIVKWSA
jgi:hypothetical protein